MPPDVEQRIEEWGEDKVHRVRVSPRMLRELQEDGITSTAGSSLVGPHLLVLETVHVDPDGDPDA